VKGFFIGALAETNYLCFDCGGLWTFLEYWTAISVVVRPPVKLSDSLEKLYAGYIRLFHPKFFQKIKIQKSENRFSGRGAPGP